MKLLFNIVVCAVLSIASLLMHISYAASTHPIEIIEKDGTQYIKGSYIISFKESSGLIDPPDPELRGKMPFGESASRQNKEELALELGINGRIAGIFESINAIWVQDMSEDEAQKWRQDERVIYVEQDMLITAATDSIEFPGRIDTPLYKNGVLTIPQVDTQTLVGNYRDATLQLDETTNMWRLISVKTANSHPLSAPLIDEIELMQIDSFPVQVFLKINGVLTGCSESLEPVSQRLIGSQFEINVQNRGPDLEPGTFGCAAVVLPFEKVIPLSVYGLSAGTYEYRVNGSDPGTFTLPEDNRFAECTGFGCSN